MAQGALLAGGGAGVLIGMAINNARCDCSLGNVSVANCLASISSPDALSSLNSAMASRCAKICHSI